MTTRMGGDRAAPVTGKPLDKTFLAPGKEMPAVCPIGEGPRASPGPSSLGVTRERVLRPGSPPTQQKFPMSTNAVLSKLPVQHQGQSKVQAGSSP